MKRVLSLFMALCIGLTLSLDANAKRFGGGKSFGSAPSHTRQAQPQKPAATPATPARPGQAGATSGASKWLGPLAGLAAGGLLASMFMGDGFEGFQIMDFLLIALIAFIAFRFIAARRRQQQPQAQAAGMPYQRESNPNPFAQPAAQPAAQPQASTGASNIFGQAIGSAAVAAPVINAPAWFNADSFTAAAREHFMSLQQHWDANEMDKVSEYVTPQLLDFLKQERAGLGDGFQSTYIDNLDVQLDGVDDNAEKTIATLTFSGVSKTSRFDQGEEFSESWRMERAQGENQPWLVAGIRQN